MARRQEALQISGFLDIFKESFMIIFAYPKIFTKITISFILPLTCLTAVAYYIDFFQPPSTNPFPTTFNNGNTTFVGSPATPSTVVLYALKLIVFKVLSLIFSFLFISTVIYSAACIHIGKEITFTKALGIIPKVWKRVLKTFLSSWCIYVAVSVFYILVLVSLCWVLLTTISSSQSSTSFGKVFGISFGLILVSFSFLVVTISLGIIFLLGYVISILENDCGMKALRKSKALIEGKMKTTVAVLLVLMICTTPSVFFLMKLREIAGNSWEKICYGILSVILTTFISLLTQVVQTVLYFVCKSHHHEPIDKHSLVAGYVEVSQFDLEDDLKV